MALPHIRQHRSTTLTPFAMPASAAAGGKGPTHSGRGWDEAVNRATRRLHAHPKDLAPPAPQAAREQRIFEAGKTMYGALTARRAAQPSTPRIYGIISCN
jgi:hypothetical protein